MISKGERAELKSVVKQQFKVLRSEIEQRELEMMAGIDGEIAERFAKDDQQWSATAHRIHEAVMTANREINNALYEGGYQDRGRTERIWVHSPTISKPQGDRMELRQRAASQIRAQGKAARLRLDRQEADLLRTLAVGAIESDEARAFLESIPTVGELVPGARLAELEADLTKDDEP